MTRTPDLSIIMPMYNVGKYIGAAIDSVLSQRNWQIELIIVNDGSTDNSADIAKKYADKYSNIRLIHKENGGLSDARNYGIKYANGKFLMFLDSDDTLENLPEFDSISADVTIFSYNIVHATVENEVYKIIEKSISPCMTKFPYDSKIFIKNWSFLNYAWNKIWKTSFIKNNNLFFEKGLSLIEDLEFCTNAYNLNPQIEFIDKIIVNYYSRPVDTLSRCYRDDLLKLIERKNILFRKYCIIFNMTSKETKRILSENASDDIRYFMSMTRYVNEYTSEIDSHIHQMIKNKYFQKSIKLKYSRTFKELIVNTIFRLRNEKLLKLLYYKNR